MGIRSSFLLPLLGAAAATILLIAPTSAQNPACTVNAGGVSTTYYHCTPLGGNPDAPVKHYWTISPTVLAAAFTSPSTGWAAFGLRGEQGDPVRAVVGYSTASALGEAHVAVYELPGGGWAGAKQLSPAAATATGYVNLRVSRSDAGLSVSFDRVRIAHPVVGDHTANIMWAVGSRWRPRRRLARQPPALCRACSTSSHRARGWTRPRRHRRRPQPSRQRRQRQRPCGRCLRPPRPRPPPHRRWRRRPRRPPPWWQPRRRCRGVACRRRRHRRAPRPRAFPPRRSRLASPSRRRRRRGRCLKAGATAPAPARHRVSGAPRRHTTSPRCRAATAGTTARRSTSTGTTARRRSMTGEGGGHRSIVLVSGPRILLGWPK